ncbi:MAG TPA: tRNA pseudouridine(38-40) synthase TruA [Vicinamibacterales bacterium]|jgi:tRNA pseudouridine38-40 synthase|nr:tRNA pseudouridine(38-40) synthase TruA [Vicinamibacterales bacterium]
MTPFRITLSYDGAGFVGWQRQASGVSIQGLIEDVLQVLDGRPVTVIGAGRTDAGVHALAQVAAFALAREIDPATLVRALNAHLPPAVRVLEAAIVPASFHPQFNAHAKAYRYRMFNADALDPFERGRAWHLPGRLDVDAMRAAAPLLEGRHDFAAFQAVGSAVETTERHIFSSRIAECGSLTGSPSAILCYEVVGNGFLRHMVRIIVGSLVEIGRGRRPAEWLGRVLMSRDRTAAGPTAPSEGLFLVRVEYPTALAAGS